VKLLGNEVYIKQGEVWPVDFEVLSKDGTPFMLPAPIRNPYVVVTLTSSRYEQQDRFVRNWWLDLSGIKAFFRSEPLYVSAFDVDTILQEYPELTTDSSDELNYICNYLFYTRDSQNKKVYSFVEIIMLPRWEGYNFRIVTTLDVSDLLEQTYLYDVKIVAGERVQEHIYDSIIEEDIPVPPWSMQQALEYVEFVHPSKRDILRELVQKNVPLMPEYDLELPILTQYKLNISTDLQRG